MDVSCEQVVSNGSPYVATGCFLRDEAKDAEEQAAKEDEAPEEGKGRPFAGPAVGR